MTNEEAAKTAKTAATVAVEVGTFIYGLGLGKHRFQTNLDHQILK